MNLREVKRIPSMSKAEYIRAHPELPSGTLIKLAASEGISLTYNRIYEVRNVVEREGKGLCLDRSRCNRKAVEGKTLCAKHLKTNAAMVRKIRADRKAKGLCWRCGKPARPGGLLCDEHRIKVTVQEREANGYKPKALQDCRICGRQTFARYCPKHRKTGLLLESRARSTKNPVIGQDCPRCGLYGHDVPHCVSQSVLVSYLKLGQDQETTPTGEMPPYTIPEADRDLVNAGYVTTPERLQVVLRSHYPLPGR